MTHTDGWKSRTLGHLSKSGDLKMLSLVAYTDYEGRDLCSKHLHSQLKWVDVIFLQWSLSL